MKRLRIALICPAESAYREMKARTLQSAALMAIASLIPPGIDLEVFEEQGGEIVRFDRVFDMAMITMMTSQAIRGYKIADQFREIGVPVVIGGIHASVLPDEALQHADAVVVGEAEGLMDEVIDDVLSGKSHGIYKRSTVLSADRIRPFRRDLFPHRESFNVVQVQASRGCPYNCNFCSVSSVFGTKYRFRPVSHVIKEVMSAPKGMVFFLDDNIVGSRKYAKELFTALKGVNRNWIGQASMNQLIRDDELLVLARESGCRGLFIGIESLNMGNLKQSGSYNKNRSDSEEELAVKIKKIQGNGIMVMASMIFGFDSDELDVFERTVEFLHKNKVALASLPILTPYPGTRLFEDMKSSGRVFDFNWENYNNETPVFQPRHISVKDLNDGGEWASYEFYKKHHILARTPAHLHNLMLYIGASIGWHIESRRYYPGYLRFEKKRRYLGKVRQNFSIQHINL